MMAGNSQRARQPPFVPMWILIPRYLRDEPKAGTQRGDESEPPGGLFESALKVGVCKSWPLRPHKGKVSVLRCSGQMRRVTFLSCLLCLLGVSCHMPFALAL